MCVINISSVSKTTNLDQDDVVQFVHVCMYEFARNLLIYLLTAGLCQAISVSRSMVRSQPDSFTTSRCVPVWRGKSRTVHGETMGGVLCC